MGIEVPERRPCPYCENLAGRVPSHGTPAVAFEDDALYVLMAPASLGGTPGHTLVSTKRHVETILDLTNDEARLLGVAVASTARAVRAAFDPDGIIVEQRNGVAAQQTVPHIHFHVIPLRDGGSYPPTEWIDVTPAEVRAEHAAVLGSHLRALLASSS